MLRLRVVQAEFGDCLILEYGRSSDRRYMLLDGGPSGTYPNHLRPELDRIRTSGGCLDRIILTHVDNDHIIGLLELMADLAASRAAGRPEPISIGGLWHNTFSEVIAGGQRINGRIQFALETNPGLTSFFPNASGVMFGISEGNKLTVAQDELGIPLNPEFPQGVVLAPDSPRPLRFSGMRLWVVGPSRAALKRLQTKWHAWLKKLEERAPFAGEIEAEKIDRSVPNLSSIMLLAESGTRRILLTGDGLGSELIEGLQAADLFDSDGKLDVDVLKLPHHGSARNISREFFQRITARTYVVSANGRYHNPDLAALIWLVEEAHKSERRVRILATNRTEATDLLIREYPPAVYGYKLQVMGAKQNSVSV